MTLRRSNSARAHLDERVIGVGLENQRFLRHHQRLAGRVTMRHPRQHLGFQPPPGLCTWQRICACACSGSIFGLMRAITPWKTSSG